MHSVALQIETGHPAFAGHFPGRPLLPGVSLLAEVLEAALAVPDLARRLGAQPRIAAAKFLLPVRPGDALLLQLTPVPDGLQFDVVCGTRRVASGRFEAAAR